MSLVFDITNLKFCSAEVNKILILGETRGGTKD